jgi:hypothetical protein
VFCAAESQEASGTRSALEAEMRAYLIGGVDRKVPPVTRHDKSPRTQLEALLKAFK